MDRPTVTVREGTLQGTTLQSVLGVNYLAFKGIPYAQPPIGPLRFKEPQPPLKWSGVRDASEHGGDVAMQYEFDPSKPAGVIGSEDCLYLNVYSRSIDHKRPVMVFIHGGGFVGGSGNECIYRQDYLMSTPIVLVYVNYRLGPFGFFKLGDKEAPGNQGLKDAILALKWIRENIGAFGGDPDNVTIFGNSAGSLICHLFTLVPATKGLFHKAILQSGSIFSARNLLKERNILNGFRIASLLGLDSDDPVKILEFLRTVPAERFVELEHRILSKQEKTIFGLRPYIPVYDGEHSDDPVIPLPLSKLLENDADIPIIVGHTSNESIETFAGRLNDGEFYKFYDENIEEIVKNYLLLREPSKFSEIMSAVRQFYLKNKAISQENAWNPVNLMTDIARINLNRKMIDLRNEHATAPTYAYNFSYQGNEPTFYSYDKDSRPLRGVAHADELAYMFYIPYMKKDKPFPQEGTKDRHVLERLIRMWYNFALTGDPTSMKDDRYVTTTWPPSERNNLFYLDIGEELVLKSDKESPSRSIYEKYSDICLF
ncbi:esterase FE4-like [Copidosoma floridanum]|uniref:esterase FE4-like n=1 Tax=Copidosoma floridanum TaxID=29053 RepID=UPI0006C9710F|nr:esterase FE4-like [Copidosoma floridanum]